MASALSALRAAGQHGTSSSVMISGPAGIGKTALLAEICEHATRMKIRVGRSKCDPVEQVCPGAPVIAALRAGRDPLISAGEYEQIASVVSEPLLLADRIASRLEDLATLQPLLIAIDDFQWADRVSRFLLRSLLSRLAGLPVVWLFASRDDSAGIDLAGHDIVRREYLRLAPLTTQDLAAMARDRLGRVPDERTRRYLHATGGNSFLATQVIDSLARSTAGGEPDITAGEFASAMARQLAGLPSSARELVELVAAAGRPLPVRDGFALMPSLSSGGGADGLAVAVRSGLITVSADALTFRHDLVRETVYAILAGHRARQLHARLAEYHLSMLGEPLVAASHARAAATTGDLASALILISAAETLTRTSAEDAGELAELAFGTVHPAQPEWLALSRRCLSVLCRAQHAARAITVADQILARIDDPDLVGQVETEAASALWLSGRVQDLVSRIERTLRSSDLDALVTVRLHAAYALACTRTLPGEPAARQAAGAVEQARDSGDQVALTLAVQAAGDGSFAASCLDVAEANAAGNPGVASFEGVALNLRGLGKQDLHILAQAVQVLDRSPRPVLRAVGAESYGRALLAAGRRCEALAQLDRAWDEYHQMGARAFRSDVQRAMRQAGVRRAKWSAATAVPETGWASLTGAERRVATLISEGNTNKSAASVLGVSINTVGTHLRAVFAKLGVQSRVELANRLAAYASEAPGDSMQRLT
jgi:DNA-binding CsgD family transcriptional regulator